MILSGKSFYLFLCFLVSMSWPLQAGTRLTPALNPSPPYREQQNTRIYKIRQKKIFSKCNDPQDIFYILQEASMCFLIHGMIK